MPNFRHRLTRARQRIYDLSNAMSSIQLQATPRLRQAVAALPTALLASDRFRVQRISQLVADEITTSLHVARVRVLVSGVRPSNARGELHGLYTPPRGSWPGRINVWMMTAKRGKVVAFKTFLRTVLHEVCHHLDYELLKLPDSMHTDGFYQRESSLFYQIGADATVRPSESKTSTAGAVAPRGPARTASPWGSP